MSLQVHYQTVLILMESRSCLEGRKSVWKHMAQQPLCNLYTVVAERCKNLKVLSLNLETKVKKVTHNMVN